MGVKSGREPQADLGVGVRTKRQLQAGLSQSGLGGPPIPPCSPELAAKAGGRALLLVLLLLPLPSLP